MARELDEKDLKILDVLKHNAEYTTRQIAKKTLLPPTTVHHRIKKLRESGVIKKFTVELDHRQLDKGFVVYILISADIQLLQKQSKTQYALLKTLKAFPFIERADIVSGGTDLIAMVRVRDVHEFDEVLLKHLQTVEGIAKTQSLIVIHEGI